MHFARSVLVIVGSLLLTMAPGVRAGIPDVVWEDAEVLDSGVWGMSSGSGSSIVHARDAWHIVYSRDGELVHRRHDGDDWTAPEVLSSVSSPGNAHLAYDGSLLHVVWVDSRLGWPSVWTRRWNGTSWAAEECLACDIESSSSSSIAAANGLAVVAWRSSEGPFESVIRTRTFSGSWGAVETVSSGPALSVSPSVAAHPSGDVFTVIWVDTRNGTGQLYASTRPYGSEWSEEEALTDLPGDCSNPSVHAEWCCGDVISPRVQIAFENDRTGVPEIHVACYEPDFGGITAPRMVSADDGVASHHPNLSGFQFRGDLCELFFGFDIDYPFLSWTDGAASGARVHRLARFEGCLDEDHGTEVLSVVGSGTAAVAAIEGNPEAGILTAWIEDSGGTPALLTRRGSQVGCFRPEIASPPPLLIAPAGFDNRIQVRDECGGGPASDYSVSLEFDSALNADLTWDVPFGTPPFQDVSDDDGWLVFPMHGGGCSQAGNVRARCNATRVLHVWDGVRSPDVDGDCIVTELDLAYVDSALGSDDFCADLDGSGTVDAIDRLIVEATLGDRCSIIGVSDGASTGPGRAELEVRPSPSRGSVSIAITLPESGTIDVRILDVGGRVVRALGRESLPGGRSTISWDGRDADGRAVAPGVYFLAATLPDGPLTRRILVVR